MGARWPQVGAALRWGRAEFASRGRAALRNFAAFRADFASRQSGATPAICSLLLTAAAPLAAQSVDAAAGFGSIASHQLGGGFWAGGSATAMFSRYVGVNGEIALRATSANARRFNPYEADINLALRPLTRRWTPELLLGYGAVRDESLACASNGIPCAQLNQPYGAAHLGADVKTYVSRRTFLRFEYHLYIIHNFFGGNASRFAVSIGYTFGGTR